MEQVLAGGGGARHGQTQEQGERWSVPRQGVTGPQGLNASQTTPGNVCSNWRSLISQRRQPMGFAQTRAGERWWEAHALGGL